MFHGPVVLLCGPRQLVDALEGVEVVPCNFSVCARVTLVAM